MIKNIFLDAGYTLAYPRAISWWFPVDFFGMCDRETFRAVEKTEEYQAAFKKGYKYLDDNHLLKSEDEEYAVLREFFRILLLPFPSLGFDEEKIKKVAERWVFDYARLALYADVIPMLEKWKAEGYKIGLISDTWPSMVNYFKHYGIYGFFDVFVMSCDHGIWKPHEIMYLSALTPLNAKGAESVFVDDFDDNLEGAVRHGIHPIKIARADNDYSWRLNKGGADYPTFENLGEVDAYIRTL